MKVACCILLALPVWVQAQIDTVYVKRWDVVRGIDGVVHTFTAPARWKNTDWMTLGGVAATTAAFTLLDEPVRAWVKDKDSDFLNDFERIGFHYGKPYSAMAITGGIYFTGVIFKNQWAKETGLMLATALTTSTVVQTFFKNAIGRARPNNDLGNYRLEPFSSKPSFHSLPSGHTTVAMVVSLVLARQVRIVPVKIFLYSLGAVTAASRLYSDVHWISDIAFGSAIAWFCADAAVKYLKDNRIRMVVRKRDAFTLKFYPYPGGLTVRAKF